MVVLGYKLADTTDLADIDLRLVKIRHRLEKEANRLYHRLLGDETAFFIDLASLNIATPDNGVPVFQYALDELHNRINKAGVLDEDSEYNFNIYVQVLVYKEDTYFKVLCRNMDFLKAFKDLEPYHLSEEECKDQKNKKTIVWSELHKMYEKAEPLSVNLTPSPTLNVEKLIFPTKDERAQTQARHSVTNRCLNQISGGQQIPPFKLMRYFDGALTMVLSESGKRLIAEDAMKIAQILPDITLSDERMFGNYRIVKPEEKPEDTEEASGNVDKSSTKPVKETESNKKKRKRKKQNRSSDSISAQKENNAFVQEDSSVKKDADEKSFAHVTEQDTDNVQSNSEGFGSCDTIPVADAIPASADGTHTSDGTQDTAKSRNNTQKNNSCSDGTADTKGESL